MAEIAKLLCNDDWTQIIVDNLHALLGYNVNVWDIANGEMHSGELESFQSFTYAVKVSSGKGYYTRFAFQAENIVSMHNIIVKDGLRIVISLDS